MSLENDLNFDSKENIEKSIADFYEKIVPAMSALEQNSLFFASKNALKYVKSDSNEDKVNAKKWLERAERMKNSLNWILNDELISNEMRNEHTPNEDKYV